MPQLDLWIWIVIAATFGLLVGSFLNVVILRLPARMEAMWRNEAREMLELPLDQTPLPPGIVVESSHCPHCKHKLAITDNIPLFGWLLLRGRCRYCKAPISVQYPLVELLTSIASALIVWKLGATLPALTGLVFTWTLIALSGIDFRTQLLPDQLNYPLLWLGLLLSLLTYFTTPELSIVGAVIGYLSLWSVYWLFKLLTGKEGMGYGDFKLLAAMGAWMGPAALLPTILLSSIIGALFGIVLIFMRRMGRDVPMPFGPFIAAAGWVWFMQGDTLLQAYLSFTGLR
ncbi:A24 family peptidase [Dyella sp.]|uniref:prepilin peptidase n=1 Tax=Dyella sp. TaxID=1869338 RepID=UPI002ED3A63E